MTSLSADWAEEAVGSGLVYAFEILGPSGTVPVQVRVTTSVAGNDVLGEFDQVSAQFIVSQTNLYSQLSGLSVGVGYSVFEDSGATINDTTTWDNKSDTSAGSSSYTDTNTYDFQTNTIYYVGLANGIFALSASSSASAYTDPTFQIAPGTPNAGSYSFIYSPGVGNGVSGVPEPSTWAMMLCGLVGLGLAGYRRTSWG